MTDKDIAIAHLTLGDAENVQTTEMWRTHWRKVFDTMAKSQHAGDCTKQNFTCSKCLTEEAYRMVPVYRELFAIKATNNYAILNSIKSFYRKMLRFFSKEC